MKRYILVAIAILFFIGSLVYLNVTIFSGSPTNNQNQVLEEDATKVSLRDPMADTDNDGLLNWEEDLYGTGKKSSDSDGDGVSDGDEVAQGTDPRSFLPIRNDTVVITEDVETYEFQQLDNPLSIEALAESLANIQNQESNVGEVSLSDPNGSQVNNEPAIRSCVNEFAIIIDNSLVTSLQDMAVLQNYINGSTTNTYAVEQLLEANRSAAEKITQFDTNKCSFMAKQIIQMGDVYNKISTALEKIVTQGPVVSDQYDYSVWVDYSEQASAWITVMNNMRIVVSGLGVNFKSTEPGIIFTQAPNL